MVTKIWHGLCALITILVALSACGLCAIIRSGAPTEVPRAVSRPLPTLVSTPGHEGQFTPYPTLTPRPFIDVTPQRLRELKGKMTSSEWRAYSKRLEAGRIRWTGTVLDIYDRPNGVTVEIQLEEHVKGYLHITVAQAASLHVGDVITFEGKATDDGFFSLKLVIKNVLILH